MSDKNNNVTGVPLKYSSGDGKTKKPARKVTKMSRRRYRKQNGAIIALCILFAVVIGFSVFFIIKTKKDDERLAAESETVESTADTGTESESEPEFTTNETESEAPDVPAVTVSNEEIYDGDLILVNFEHEYVFPTDDVLVQMKPYAEHYLVSTIDVSLQKRALDAFVSLTGDLVANGGSGDVLVVSSFRTVEKQQEIYQDRVDRYGPEYAAAYVADPGYSEHHTGLAMDLSVYTGGGSYDIDDYEGTEWFMENYDRYGYILRYPEHKAEITKINFEGWHYRYVGLPHSLIMDSLDLCLEEYIEEYLPEHTLTSAVCYNSASGEIKTVNAASYGKAEGEYLVYYVPAAEGGSTEIPVVSENYEISGTNVSGFVVTVK
ncbi:MAG: M15 family metallopeptidase [Clostridia bacterium]|nr:M15 family metallopeptidase [Clostridia bacterium]